MRIPATDLEEIRAGLTAWREAVALLEARVRDLEISLTIESAIAGAVIGDE